jgi:hypothetical protein
MRREVRRLAASETARKHATQFLWSYIFHYDFLGFWYGAPKPYEFRHRFHVEIWCAHLEHNHGCCDLLGRARCQTPCRCSRAKPDHISVGTHATQDASTPFSAHGTFLRSQRRFFIVLPDDLCHQIKPIDQMKSYKNPNEPTDH